MEDTHSLHITVSCYQKNTWGDLFEKVSVFYILPLSMASFMLQATMQFMLFQFLTNMGEYDCVNAYWLYGKIDFEIRNIQDIKMWISLL